MKKNILLLSPFILAIYISCAIPKPEYSGKITCRLFISKSEMKDFSHTAFIYNNHLFEKLEEIQIYEDYDVDGSKLKVDSSGRGSIKTSELTPSRQSINTLIKGYKITNLSNFKCTEFSRDSLHPKITAAYLAGKKDSPFRVLPEHISFFNVFPEKLSFTKDTLINNRKIKLLEEKYSNPDPKMKMTKLRAVAHIDTSLPNFPFHISKNLDKKFNGFTNYIEIFYDYGLTVAAQYNFEKGLSEDELIEIKKFISLAEEKK